MNTAAMDSPMDTPNSSSSTFDTSPMESQSTADFTLDDLLDSNLLSVVHKEVPELSFTHTSPNSSSCEAGAFFRRSSEERNTSTFLKAAPGVLFGNLSQTDIVMEPVADKRSASAVLKTLDQDIYDQHFGIENVISSMSQSISERSPCANTVWFEDTENDSHSQLYPNPNPQNLTKARHTVPTESGFALSGWAPADDSFDIVDLPSPQPTNASYRQPLKDVTSECVNENADINTSSTPRLNTNQANAINSTYVYDTPYNNSNDAPLPPSQYPKSFKAEINNAPVLSDINSGSFDRISPPPAVPLMRCTPSGRPIGGVPPEFARMVVNKAFKKERAKEDAKRAKRGTVDDQYVPPTKRNRIRKYDAEEIVSDKRSRGDNKNPASTLQDRVSVARRSNSQDVSMASPDVIHRGGEDIGQVMGSFLDIDGILVKEAPSSLANALGQVSEDSSIIDRTAKRVGKKGGRVGDGGRKRLRL